LPVGISFYTFQTISYTIDVYLGKIKPEKHFGIYAVYVSFFPQLVAGPIERAKHLLPQLLAKHAFKYERVVSGLRLILWGLFKKVVIADRLAVFVDSVYGDVSSYSGPFLFFATFLFAFQIYCDFSGYIDIARGSAKVLGINLIKNFKRPFLATSVAEFWRRWHISLSSWFQDYVFTPLFRFISRKNIFKNLKSKYRHLIVFAISMLLGEALLGLWHGANWTFILFGIYYGILISIYYVIRDWYEKMFSPVKIFITFLLTLIGWIFFRANSIADLSYILNNLFVGWSLRSVQQVFFEYGYNVTLISFVFFLGFFIIQYLKEKKYPIYFYALPIYLRWSIYFITIYSILIFGTFGANEFIYFQF
jgi:D-alanyl-lipoteichoic acid acyltransferase DltB (MBOAT superfamily)